jgi:uncharacterized protein (DUF433 family)
VLAPLQHIGLNEHGIAYVAGTAIRVATIAVDAVTWGLTPAESQDNYPRLSLAQIHAALAYYDHQAKIDAKLAAWDAGYEELRSASPDPLTREQWEARRQARQGDQCVCPR